MSNETAPTAPAAEKPKTASELLKEVHAEADAAKAAPKKPKGGKKPAAKSAKKKDAAPAAEAGPDKNAPTVNIMSAVDWKEETVKRLDITKDRAMQHRKELQDLSEGGAVELYTEAMKAGDKFPRVKIVRDTSDTPDKGKLWLVDGFQRMGAYDKTKAVEVDALVVEGNRTDAILLSLASNSDNSVIPRTKEDKRRSVWAILDNPSLRNSLLANSKGNGGVIALFSKAAHVAAGTVVNALRDRGYKAKIDTLVALPKEAPATKKAEAKPSAALDLPKVEQPVAQVSAEEQKQLDRVAYEAIALKNNAELVLQVRTCVKRIAAVTSVLVTRPDVGEAMAQRLADMGMAFDPEFFDRFRRDGKNFSAYMEALELWPIIGELIGMTDGFSEVLAATEEAAKQPAESAA